MNDYKYDYNRTCFMRKKDESGNIEYYLKVNHQYINVNKKVFKVCKNSYNQIKYAEKIKAERSVLNYQDIDQSAFFSVQKARNNDVINQIYLKDLANRIKEEIKKLPDRDRNIATCIFLNEFTD